MSTNSSITSSEWSSLAVRKLRDKNFPSARLDVLIILEQVLKQPRIALISDQAIKLTDSQLKKLNILLCKRLKHVPIAYLTGVKEFYGREFIVNSSVLIPRPESEVFIDLVKELQIKGGRVADIGCGSGCLGITLKLELPKLNVYLFDKSAKSLIVAKANAKRLNAAVITAKADLLSKLDGQFGLILANLPYVPTSMMSLDNLAHEPPEALFADKNGMALYEIFWREVFNLNLKPNYVATESLEVQHTRMASLARSINYRLVKTKGLVQLFMLIN